MVTPAKQTKAVLDFEADLLNAWVNARMETDSPFWFKEFYALRGYTSAQVANMKKQNKKFGDAAKRAHYIQECLMPKWALLNKVDRTVAIFLLKVKFGFVEKQHLEHSGGVQVVIKGDDAKL